MAHLAKYKQTSVGAMVRHYDRRLEATLERANIDRSRTHLNYEVGARIDIEHEILSRKAEHNDNGRAIRSDAVVLADWVITLPRDFPQERQREFFERCHEFCEARYERAVVPQGYVHLDESQPHMHQPIVTFDTEKHRFQTKIVNQYDLKTFHKDLEKHLERELGMERVGITLSQKESMERLVQTRKLPLQDWQVAQDALREVKQETEQLRQQMAQERQQHELQMERLAHEQNQAQQRLESLRQREGDLGRSNERMRERIGQFDEVIERKRTLAAAIGQPGGLRKVERSLKEGERQERSRGESLGRRTGELEREIEFQRKVRDERIWRLQEPTRGCLREAERCREQAERVMGRAGELESELGVVREQAERAEERAERLEEQREQAELRVERLRERLAGAVERLREKVPVHRLRERFGELCRACELSLRDMGQDTVNRVREVFDKRPLSVLEFADRSAKQERSLGRSADLHEAQQRAGESFREQQQEHGRSLDYEPSLEYHQDHGLSMGL